MKIVAISLFICVLGIAGFLFYSRNVPAMTSKPVSSLLPGVMLISSAEATAGNPGNISSIRPDGSERISLTSADTINTLASWSYDGSKIVFMSRSKDSDPQIWTMNADGSNKKQLTNGAGGLTSTFSPDGNTILYSGLTSGNPELWVMNADGTHQRQLTHTTKSSRTHSGNEIKWSIHGTYSPDGKRIVYASTESGSSEIWVMNADGTHPKQLTFSDRASAPDANAPAWSPDGKKIVFWSGFETENGNIWIMNADGTERTQLTFQPTDRSSDNPSWSPDGAFIAFETNRSNTIETWVMRTDGSEQRILFPFPYGAGRHPWKQ